MFIKLASSQAAVASIPAASGRQIHFVNPARSLITKSQVPTEIPQEKEDKLATFKGKTFPDFETTYRKRGAGGRSSFNGITATVFGGASFVARSLISRLGKSGTQVVIAYRGSGYSEQKLRIAGDLGQIYYSHFHLKDEKSLYSAMEFSNVVINCVGKQSETRNFSFDDVHVEGPRRMARIAREIGVKKFIHLSSLNASPNPTPICLKNGSQFLKSKYYGELAVKEEFPDAIIFRPSDILGEADNFLNHFTSMLRNRYSRSCPIWDYYDGVEKQPVFVKDLVSGIEKAMFDDSANGKIFQAVGPYRYNFEELIEFIRACGGQGAKLDDCRITNLRHDWIVRLAISVASAISKNPFLTWERVERDSTSDYVDPNLPTLRDLGVELTPLEQHITVNAHYRPRLHRIEIPYESQMQIDLPQRLNVTA